MKLPHISIITPSFNQGRYIRQTLESVLSQGYPDLEYRVVDGGSTDETLSILEDHATRLRWTSEPDRGQAHAINKGLRTVSGEVLAFLNSDDLYEPGALLAVGEFFARHPEAGWVSGRCRTIDQDGREVRRGITAYKNLRLRARSYAVLCVLNYISQPATFWRREALEVVGLLDEALHYTMDYDYWLRLGRRFPLWFLDAPLARFRIHAGSKSGSTAGAQFDEELAVAKRHTRAATLLQLHELHKALAESVYRRWYIRTRPRGYPARLSP